MGQLRRKIEAGRDSGSWSLQTVRKLVEPSADKSHRGLWRLWGLSVSSVTKTAVFRKTVSLRSTVASSGIKAAGVCSVCEAY